MALKNRFGEDGTSAGEDAVAGVVEATIKAWTERSAFHRDDNACRKRSDLCLYCLLLVSSRGLEYVVGAWEW
jgi:hypothetical protein